MSEQHRHGQGEARAVATKDPVCGMNVVAGQTPGGSANHGGTTYWFCSPTCREKFVAEPHRYVAPPPAAPAPTDDRLYTCPMHPEVRQRGPGSCPQCGMALEALAPAPTRPRTKWTCPMHPQIVRDEPGSCPICGMALEPMTPAADEGPDPELVDMTRRFWIGLVLTLPLLAFVMGDMLPGQPLRHLISGRVLAWLQLILATPVVLWAGWPFFVRGWASIVNRSLNMFTLIAIGTGMAYAYSVVGTFAPGFFPESFRTHGGEIGLYFEAAAVITALVLLGQVLDCMREARPAAPSRRC